MSPPEDANTLGRMNPLRYRGYVYDQEMGLYYVSSRYYDPEIGRFINADTTDVLTATPMALTDKNLYAYCDNNPVMREDKGGQFWNIIAGAVIGGGLELAGQLLSGKSLSEVNWAKVAVRSIDLHPNHNNHGIHLQGNKWNPKTGNRGGDFFRWPRRR